MFTTLKTYRTEKMSENIRFEYLHRITLPFAVIASSPFSDAAMFWMPTCWRVVDVSSIFPPENVMFSIGEQTEAKYIQLNLF